MRLSSWPMFKSWEVNKSGAMDDNLKLFPLGKGVHYIWYLKEFGYWAIN